MGAQQYIIKTVSLSKLGKPCLAKKFFKRFYLLPPGVADGNVKRPGYGFRQFDVKYRHRQL
jgi:hypothetical protein